MKAVIFSTIIFHLCLANPSVILAAKATAPLTSLKLISYPKRFKLSKVGLGEIVFSNERDKTIRSYPKVIEGALMLPLNTRSRKSTSEKIDIELDREAYVFIGYDPKRKADQLPKWLKNWQKLESSPFTTIQMQYQLYAKKFPKGKVQLGPNCGSGSMYLLLAKAASETNLADAKVLVGFPRKEPLKEVVSNDTYEGLVKLIASLDPYSKGQIRVNSEVYNKQALIQISDKTPVDVILRRTSALLKKIQSMSGAPSLTSEAENLKKLTSQNSAGLSVDKQKELFAEIKILRRKIAFKNPLLNFDEILFVKHDKMAHGEGHMVDQYLGFNQKIGGGVYVLKRPFSEKPEVKSLLANSKVKNGRLKGQVLEDKGSFISLEMDYEAKHMYFAYTEALHQKYEQGGKEKDRVVALKNERGAKKHCGAYYAFTPKRNFQIFRANIDGSELTALTDASHNDFDPCVLPNGRIVFISDRIEGNQRCGARYNSTYTLHGMMPDGSDIIPFSYHDTNEWHPSVDNNGMIIYTRWDYVDRDSDVAHHIWHCFPDGRDPRSYHGNYPLKRENRPWMELANRAIPNSHKYISVAAPHHGQNYGSLVMIDIRQKDDGAMSQVKRITPEVLFPESELAPGVAHGKGRHRPNGEVYGQPWPLSEDFYLCTYSISHKQHALYLVDSFGNKELLYKDPKIGCLDPMPLRPRFKPPDVPVQTQQAKADKMGKGNSGMGTVTIMNIYDSEYPWPKDTKIKELRIVNVFAKPNSYAEKPRIGIAAQSLARGILGVVPVEEDGSAHFECPTGMAIYFQALDENGFMVQNMRSATYLHPGETMSCIGCHESKHNSPKNTGKTPTALKRGPSKIVNKTPGSYPLSFPRLIQPVLNKKCVSCHEKEKKAKSLRGDKFVKGGYSEAWQTLSRYGWGKSGGNGAIRGNKRSYSIPGQEGFRVSGLYKKLVKEKHHDLKLTKEELRRFAAWIDCNTNFYGAYVDTELQAKGKVVEPLLGKPKHIAFKDLVR